jgi:hypothetical protein
MQAASGSVKTQKSGDSWGYESPDEEDIEVCSRSIDLWGSLFINYYNVACQAFFSLFFYIAVSAVPYLKICSPNLSK